MLSNRMAAFIFDTSNPSVFTQVILDQVKLYVDSKADSGVDRSKDSEINKKNPAHC